MTNEEIIEQIKQWEGPVVEGEPSGFWCSGAPSSERAYGNEGIRVTHIHTNKHLLHNKYQMKLSVRGLSLLSRHRTDAHAYPVLQTFPLTPHRDELLAAVRMYMELVGGEV